VAFTNPHTDDVELPREFFQFLGLTQDGGNQGWLARFASADSGESVDGDNIAPKLIRNVARVGIPFSAIGSLEVPSDYVTRDGGGVPGLVGFKTLSYRSNRGDGTADDSQIRLVRFRFRSFDFPLDALLFDLTEQTSLLHIIEKERTPLDMIANRKWCSRVLQVPVLVEGACRHIDMLKGQARVP